MDIIKMSLSASVMIVAIVIIRALTLNKLPKRTFLVLWGVVVCRLLIPFSIPSYLSFYTGVNMVRRMLTERVTVSSTTGITAIPNVANMPGLGGPMGASAPTAAISPLEIVWLAGIFAYALFFIVAYVKCRREFKMSLPVENSFTARWLREHSLRRPVQIRQSDRIKSPLTYGVFRPVILLPRRTDWSDETRLRYILTHEFAHIRRFDTLTKLILTAAVCVHWFNPLVWLMYVLANRDIELSCDETVIRTFGETEKSAYALTLIGLEEKKGRLTPLVNNFSKNAIEERIVSIMKIKRTSLVGIILSLVLVIGTTTVFATNAANATDASSSDTNYSDPSNSVAPEATATIPVDNESDANNFNNSNEKVEETNPAAVPVGIADTTTTASPQNDSTKNSSESPAAEQPNSTTKDDTVSQTPAPANQDSGKGTNDNSSYVYPVNKNGETYGSSAYGNPDLILTYDTKFGNCYIRARDIPGANVSTPEEATAYMAYMKSLPTHIMVTLYDQDDNVIGETEVYNSLSAGANQKAYDSLEEAQEAARNGG